MEPIKIWLWDQAPRKYREVLTNQDDAAQAIGVCHPGVFHAAALMVHVTETTARQEDEDEEVIFGILCRSRRKEIDTK